MNKTQQKNQNKRVLITGNDAIGNGAVKAGCDCYFGYPITPQNELTAYMSKAMLSLGRTFIQAESELAAINMVFGAAAAGKRAMTSSSSPGISLKQEGISYLAAAQLPAVIINVERGGPGLGNIAPSQGDYLQATRGGGHGDYRTIVLAPTSVQEMHNFTMQAFELADKYRIPVLILADGRLGQMMEPIQLYQGPTPTPPPKPWALTGAKNREGRYIRSLFLKEGELEQHNLKLQKQYQTISNNEIRSEDWYTDDCDLLIAAWGTCNRISKGVVKQLRAKGIKAGLFRPVTLWPFPLQRLSYLAEKVKNVFVVEMNAGQMLEDVRLAVKDKAPISFAGFMGGRVPSESDILQEIYKKVLLKEKYD
jgi:2-oxoglutarate/2-oxoacid ferredoxin oxidoreductase subunit alpha